MIMRVRMTLLALLGLVVAAAGCSRMDLTAVRHGVTDSGSRDSGGDGDSGSGDRSGGDRGGDSGGDRGGDRGGDSSDSGSADRSSDGVEGGSTVTCPTPALKQGDTTQTVLAGSRSYLLHVPQQYDGSKPVPLILDFHALPGTGVGEKNISRYPAVVDQEGVIMAFPNGLSGPSGGAWNVGPCCVTGFPDDVGFAKAVVEHIKTLACIDPSRVFAVGNVIGGGMAYYLACNAAEVFAGIAAFGFDLLQDNVAECQPSRPITVVSFRNTGDVLVPYAGGPSSFVSGMPVTFLGAQKTFQTWASLDGCTGSPSGPDSDGCSAYTNCDEGVEVMLCNSSVPDPTIAWPLLKQHPKP
jgi:polyhydroxybutyrate depolymerase